MLSAKYAEDNEPRGERGSSWGGIAGCTRVSVWDMSPLCGAMCCTDLRPPHSSAELSMDAALCLHGLGSKGRRKCCLQPFWHSHSHHSWSVTDTSFKSRLRASVFKVWTGIMQQLHLVWDCKQNHSARERQTILSLVKQHFVVVRVSSEYDLDWIVLFQERSV